MNQISKQKPIIGILGGMGPQASACLVNLLVEMSAKDFGAKKSDDFPEIILDSVPVPDFITTKFNQANAAKMLKTRVKMLGGMNVSIFALSCNTAHLLLNQLQSVSKRPFVSMVDEVVKEVVNQKLKRVGLLATPVTIKSRLFQTALDKHGISVVLPLDNDLKLVDDIIRRIISGKVINEDRLSLLKISNKLQDNGAEGIILGCTELPLVFPKKIEIPLFDALKILAKALLHISFGGNKITL